MIVFEFQEATSATPWAVKESVAWSGLWFSHSGGTVARHRSSLVGCRLSTLRLTLGHSLTVLEAVSDSQLAAVADHTSHLFQSMAAFRIWGFVDNAQNGYVSEAGASRSNLRAGVVSISMSLMAFQGGRRAYYVSGLFAFGA